MARTFGANFTTEIAKNAARFHTLVLIGLPSGTLAMFTVRAHDAFPADYTVLHDRLITVGDIDSSVDVFDAPLAQTTDVEVVLRNEDGYFDASTLAGKIVQICICYGPTAGLSYIELFFTGRIAEAQGNKMSLKLTCRGKDQQYDCEISTPVVEGADTKYRGQIYPMTYGNFQDDNGYMPIIIDQEINKIPQMVFDKNAWSAVSGSFVGLYLWDKDGNRSYRSKQGSDILLAAGYNSAIFAQDSGITVGMTGIPEVGNTIWVSDVTGLTPEALDGSTTPTPKIIQIDDEQMLVISVTSATEIIVERGYNGTTQANHNSGVQVNLINSDSSSLKIGVSHKFYPEQVSDVDRIDHTYYPMTTTDMRRIGGLYDELLNRSEAVADGIAFEHTHLITGGVSVSEYRIKFALVFPKIGISGTVENQYVIAKVSVRSLWNDGYATAYYNYAEANIIKNGETDDPDAPTEVDHFTEGMVNLGIARAATNSVNKDSGDIGFNNYDGSDGETDKPVKSAQKISSPTDLNSNQFAFSFKHFSTLHVDADGWCNVAAVGFRLDFTVDPLEYDFYVRAKGRVNPGGYFNGSAGDLMENPSSIIEDFIKTALPQQISGREAAFDAFYTARAAWKGAISLHSDMEKYETTERR